FGLLEAQGDGTGIEEARMEVEEELGARVRERARAMGVSAACGWHVAWGRVLGQVSGREDVVFGTVLSGRMGGGEGQERAVGLFINTLPIRLGVGSESAEGSVRSTQELLGELMRHERASLAQAQRLSGVAAPTPLFSSLLNYRHSPREEEQLPAAAEAAAGGGEREPGGRTHSPAACLVTRIGGGMCVTGRMGRGSGAGRICGYGVTVVGGLLEALERAPEMEVRTIGVLPEAERRQLVEEWNRTEAEYSKEKRIHDLFEEQVERSPEAIA